MIVLFTGLGALTAVLTFVVVSRRLRGTTRRRRSHELVEATEVSSWMSELMDAMNPEPPALLERHDLADQPEPEPVITSTELAQVFAMSPRALPAGPPRAVPSGPPRAVAHFGH